MKILFKLFLLLTLLSSCALGLKKVIVPNLSYIVASKTADQLDLFYSQEKKLKVEIDDLFKKNIFLIQELKTIIKNIDLKKSSEKEITKKIQSLLKKALLDFNILLAKYTAKLNSSQQKEFFEIQKKKNEKLKEKLNSETLESVVSRYEFFFDDLNDKQKEIINKNKVLYKKIYEERLARRLKTQLDLKEAFKIKDEDKRLKEIKKAYDRSLIKGQENPLMPKAIGIVMLIIDTLESDQIKYFYEKKAIILDWIDEFIKVYK